MSAQAGIWNKDGEPVDRNWLSQVSDALRRQGPDGEFMYVDGPLGLVYRPFHTTAESRREKQPYISPRGCVITWDGRLDNRDELVPALIGDLGSLDPAEVAIVGAAFDRWGTDCFRRLVGDWAASVWNPQERILVLAIDYMAIRHLFYHQKQDSIRWSTDLTPLVLLSGDTFHVDDEYIAGYFAHDPEAHLTPYREIREVPPGQFVRVTPFKATTHQYWTFTPSSRVRYRRDQEYEEHFRHVLWQAVKTRLRSDQPVLAELSGGLDSSGIVSVADRILATERGLTPHLDTLSYYDQTEPNGDDWLYFPIIEKRRGRVGAHIDASKLATSTLSLEHSEFAAEPGPLNIGYEIEAERAAIVRDGGYRAVLSGIGGDEFLGGIPNPHSQLADALLQLKLGTLAKQLVAWSLIKRKPLIHLLWGTFAELLPSSLTQLWATQGRVEPWIDKKFASRTRIPLKLLDVKEHFGLLLPTRRSCIGGVVLMSNKVSKWSGRMLALEEVRYPYLDQRLIEFILAIPATQLLRPGDRRSLMRRSLKNIVPEEILSRQTKQFGARTPVMAIERNLDEVRKAFESPVSATLGYINKDAFMERLDAARAGKQIHITRMLRTISLELWLHDLMQRQLIDVNTSAFNASGASSVTGRSKLTAQGT